MEMAEGSSTQSVSNEQPSAKSPPSNSPSFLETPSGSKIAYGLQPGSTPGVIYLHGLCSHMSSVRGERLAEHCREKGVFYLRFDLSGHGRSSGTIEQSTISSWLEDVAEVLDSLTRESQVIVGDGLGAWLMFLYTMRNPDRVFGLVGVAPGVDFTHRLWKNLDKDTRKEIQRVGKYPFPSPVSEDAIVLSLDLIVDGEKHSILDMPGIELIKSPTWLLHGAEDTKVPPNVSIKLMQSMQCPVELKVVEGGDHLLNRPEELQVLINAIDSLLSCCSNDGATVQEGDDDD